MGLPFVTPSRCVLLIGDEGLYIYNVAFNTVRLAGDIPWQTDDFDEAAVDLIRKECKGKSVLILNDMTDQHFKGGQRIPPVGVMDKANVVKRKLAVAFPNYPIRGALPLGKPKGLKKAGKSKGGDLYLFAAVPASEPITRTMSVAQKSMAPITGFFLLPIEAADMVQAAAKKVAGKKRTPSRWVIFIGQHRSGALRQVITRDGQLAMTRMTPLGEGAGSGSESWAREVNQEFRATISYLSRFGFSPDEGVDVIVVAGRTEGAALEALIDIPCHYVSMTAPEIGRELGVNIGSQDNPAFADPLYAAWVGRKARFTLPMKADEIDRVTVPRRVAAAAMLLMVVSGGWLAWQAMSYSQSVMTVRDDIQTQKVSLARAENDYNSEVERMKALGFDVRLVQGAISAFDELEKRRMKPLSLIRKVGIALGGELRLDALSVNYISHADGAPQIDPNTGQEIAATPEVEASLKLSFPPTVEPEVGVREIEGLKRRLTGELPGFAVEIEKNVAGFEYADSLQGTTGRSAKELAEEDRTAVIKVKGPVQ
ncbi:MAG TPA: hypothetical protein VIG74_00080 [Alphaproteobacteria bacterium]|jgi:hypothetical protein